MRVLKTILKPVLMIAVLGSFAIGTAQWGKTKECLYGSLMTDAVAYGAQQQLNNSSISDSLFLSRMNSRLDQVKVDHSRSCKASTHLQVPVLDTTACQATSPRDVLMACMMREEQRKDFLKPNSLYWKLVMNPLIQN